MTLIYENLQFNAIVHSFLVILYVLVYLSLKAPISRFRSTVPHYMHLCLLFQSRYSVISSLSVTFPPPLSLPISSDRDSFHYCSQSGPGGQLLCTSVHLNIILLIKGLPPLPPLPCSRSCPFPRTAPAFCSPRLSPTRFMSSHALAI